MQPFNAKKSLGQNFLTNPKIAEKIAKTAGITAGETVLEIGPGTGMLTRALLKEGARVLAIEADQRAIEVLKETFSSILTEGYPLSEGSPLFSSAQKLTLIHGDIREIELRDLPLPQKYRVAANIPYYLSGYLFEKMLESDRQPETIVFLVQKEVAERITRSKKESILSLSVKAYGTPTYEGTVSRGNFSPQPGVDSAILKISRISKKYFVEHSLDERFFFKVLKAGFKARRKHLLGNLSALASRTELIKVFNDLAISPKARGEDLPIESWLKLSEALSNVSA